LDNWPVPAGVIVIRPDINPLRLFQKIVMFRVMTLKHEKGSGPTPARSSISGPGSGVWDVMRVLREGTRFLENHSVEHARLNAEQLLCRTLGLSRIQLYLQFARPLSSGERRSFRTFLKRRAAREPLQYILGDTEFMSLTFSVSPAVLIPRPETEILVERALEEIREMQHPRILDLGTGSGNIAVSLAHYLPGALVVGVDVSPGALEVARENARTNGVEDRVRFQKADILQEDLCRMLPEAWDLVVSNPPYVTGDEWEGLAPEIRSHEPREALCDGGDGLAFYRKIAEFAGCLIKSGGRLLLEVGDGQAGTVIDILKKKQFAHIRSFPDLNGIERVVSASGNRGII
jgi:release factor glutamine methyltransferase